MDGIELARALWLGRPEKILERSRFILGGLTVCSLLFSAPSMIASSGDDRPAVVVCSLLLLISIEYCCRKKRVAPWADVLEAACLCTFMGALPTPLTAFTFMFPLLWSRALYGGPGRMLFRCALHATGMLLSVPLSHILSQPIEPDLRTFLTVGLSSIFFISIAGQQLGIGMQAHDDGARRERLISDSGTRLLGITDPQIIRSISRETLDELITGIPELRVISFDRHDDHVVVRQAVGSFTALPSSLAVADLGLSEDGRSSANKAGRSIQVLDEAVGIRCEWVILSFLANPGAPSRDGTVSGERIFLAFSHPGRLGADIVPAVESIANQGAMAMRNSEIHRELSVQALTDGMTGLANRQGFTEATERLIAASGNTATAVLFINLDDFKEVNDTLGHKAGDELLVQVAKLLTSVTRADDIAARLGGDEFAILLKNTTRQAAEQVADRVVLAVSVLSVANNTNLSVGASIGVAMASSQTCLEDLLVQADVAMYAAKAHGKNPYSDVSPHTTFNACAIIHKVSNA